MIEARENTKQEPIVRAGDLKSYEVLPNGISIETDKGICEIVFYSSSIVRVHYYENQKDENPYAVIQDSLAQPLALFTVEDNDSVLNLIGEELDISIVKTPLALTFLTKEGKVLNEDDPGLGMQAQGEQKTVYKKLQEGERFVGLGEKTGPLDRKGKGYQNWNTDQFAYDVEADPLYASIPFYMGIHNGLSYGVFLDNSYKSHFNFGASNRRFSSFSVDGGDLDYYFFAGSVKKIIEGYTWLTGRMSLPPLWSIGYQQCRYSYYPDTEVLDVAKKFRDKDIPADVIVLDIHYMDEYKIFTWDKERFSNPEEMIQKLKEMGFEVVVIFDPGIKPAEGYKAYELGKKQDVFLKYPDGVCYEGEVWPGWCHFPDFTDESVRKWWGEMMESYTSIGIKGFWNDMNEIATWGQTLPENIMFNMEGSSGTTRKGRNIYGMQMARSSFEGAKNNLKGERPFNLTRAAFAGIQRYSALWTGDNVANDEHMLLGVRLVNSLGLSGVAFSGYDVGGFAGNGQSNLFARWVQIGTFSPFFRGHSMINSHDSEPWSYGEEVEEISKNYIRLRYMLLPYLYSAFLESAETGIPINRSLSIDYAHDDKVYDWDYENQYFFGDAIMVAPIKSSDRFAKIYLPEGQWYEFFTDERLSGNQEFIREYQLERLPLFVKGSSIIPYYPESVTNSQNPGSVLELHIYNGSEENAFDYYEDDGVSYDYADNKFHRRKIEFDPNSKKVVLQSANGSYSSKMEKLRLIFHGFELDNCQIEGFKLEKQPYAFVTPISNFDPFVKEDRNGLKIDHVYTLETSYQDDEMVFAW